MAWAHARASALHARQACLSHSLKYGSPTVQPVSEPMEPYLGVTLVILRQSDGLPCHRIFQVLLCESNAP